MSDSFVSVDVSIESRPRARFNPAIDKTVIDCGMVRVYLGSVEDLHCLIDELQDTVREMARHQSEQVTDI